MPAQTPKFKEWLAAEKDAQAAERELHAVMLQFGQRMFAPPSEELVQSARALRARAHGLFDEAMHEMKERAESLHHRRVLRTIATHESSRSGPRDDGGDAGVPSLRT